MIQVILSFVTLALMVFALVTVITSDGSQINHLPKFAWVLLIIFLPLIGSILWFALGRERASTHDIGGFGDPRRSEPNVIAAPYEATRQRTTEEELAAVDREIEYYEKQRKIRELEQELRSKRDST
jgi:hypothetical protein